MKKQTKDKQKEIEQLNELLEIWERIGNKLK